MGSQGTGGFNEILVGFNTEKVVRTSDVPVLVIKEHNSTFKIKNILFACDFLDEAVLAFKNVKDFTNIFLAKLELIYINTPYDNFISNTEIENRISRFFYKSGEDAQEVTIYSDYNVEKGLMNFSKKKDFDILSIPTHGRKRLSRYLFGSIGEDVAKHANLPVFTFKIKKEFIPY
jgi:hypothetical protein